MTSICLIEDFFNIDVIKVLHQGKIGEEKVIA